LLADQRQHLELLKKIRRLDRIKKVFVASGIRYDLLLSDKENGKEYLRELVENHVSGQMKLAPEHTESSVLHAMGKPGPSSLIEFKKLFDKMSAEAEKKQFLTYYLIAAHPGCTQEDMWNLKHFADRTLKMTPEQVQIYLPLPSTYSALMYYTETDPFSNKPLFVEKDPVKKERQKDIVVEKREFRQDEHKKFEGKRKPNFRKEHNSANPHGKSANNPVKKPNKNTRPRFIKPAK
jgi:uncharacterized radical SAM protein YgiQ